MGKEDLSESVIFPLGNKAEGPLANVFTGDAWIEMLVTEEEFNCPTYNVTFAPCGRNYWHSHPGGQLLFVTGGQGWYQEEGKSAQLLKVGDVVKIPANVKHWHGATKTSWFVHLGVTTNVSAGDAVWFEEVSDEEYDKL